jgi:dTMP kinase
MTKLIAFEGIDGSGKSTQIELLKQHLQIQNYKVLTTKEPGATYLGKEIRKLVLHTGEKDALTNLFLFCADRTDHIQNILNPAIDYYDFILTDRFFFSTFVYQHLEDDWNGFVEYITYHIIKNLNLDLKEDFLSIILDISPEEAYNRLKSEKDGQFEKRGLDFLSSCRTKYLSLLDFPFSLIVDASLPEEAVHSQIAETIDYAQKTNPVRQH